MNIWFFPSIIWCALFSVAICLMYLFVYSKFRRGYIAIWLCAWMAYVFRFSFDLLSALFDGDIVLQTFGWYSGLVCSVLIFYGVKYFLNKRIELFWSVSVGVVVFLDVFCLVSGNFRDVSSVVLLFLYWTCAIMCGSIVLERQIFEGVTVFCCNSADVVGCT